MFLYPILYLLIWQNDHKVIENGRGKDAAMRKLAKDSGNRDNNRSTVKSVRSWHVANDQNGHFVHTRRSHSHKPWCKGGYIFGYRIATVRASYGMGLAKQSIYIIEN